MNNNISEWALYYICTRGFVGNETGCGNHPWIVIVAHIMLTL